MFGPLQSFQFCLPEHTHFLRDWSVCPHIGTESVGMGNIKNLMDVSEEYLLQHIIVWAFFLFNEVLVTLLQDLQFHGSMSND